VRLILSVPSTLVDYASNTNLSLRDPVESPYDLVQELSIGDTQYNVWSSFANAATAISDPSSEPLFARVYPSYLSSSKDMPFFSSDFALRDTTDVLSSDESHKVNATTNTTIFVPEKAEGFMAEVSCVDAADLVSLPDSSNVTGWAAYNFTFPCTDPTP
jgi:hypothetical protein